MCFAGISDHESKEQLREQQTSDKPEHPVRTGQRQPSIQQPRDIPGKSFEAEIEQQQHRSNQQAVGKVGSHQPLGPFGSPAKVTSGVNRLKHQPAEQKEQGHSKPGQVMIRGCIAGVSHDYKNNAESFGGINP
ncbi:hypothetical protein D3C74_387610 [compost metagenome]